MGLLSQTLVFNDFLQPLGWTQVSWKESLTLYLRSPRYIAYLPLCNVLLLQLGDESTTRTPAVRIALLVLSLSTTYLTESKRTVAELPFMRLLYVGVRISVREQGKPRVTEKS